MYARKLATPPSKASEQQKEKEMDREKEREVKEHKGKSRTDSLHSLYHNTHIHTCN